MLRRWVCFVVSHRYQRVRIPGSDAPDGFFLRCRRCGHERDEPPGGSALAAGMAQGA